MSEPEKTEDKPEEPATTAEASGDVVFDTLWDRVLEAWEDDKTHAALLDHALRNQMLPELAGRYRTLAGDPLKGSRAKKKIDGVVVAATQMLMSMKTSARPKTPWQLTAVVAVVSVAVMIWLAFKILQQH